MAKKVEKDKIVKELENENLVADYVAAGWKIVEDKNKMPKEMYR